MHPPEVHTDVISADLLRQLMAGWLEPSLGHRHGRHPTMARPASMGRRRWTANTFRCHRPATQAVRASTFPATAQLHRSCLAFKPSGIAVLCPAHGISDTLDPGTGRGEIPLAICPTACAALAWIANPATVGPTHIVAGLLAKKLLAYSKPIQRRWASFFSSAMRRLALSCFCSSCMRSRSVTLPSSLMCSS